MIAVDEEIKIVGNALEATDAVALILLAIARRLHARGCTRSLIGGTTCPRHTRTGLAICIHSGTGRWHEALDARTRTVAEIASLATRSTWAGEWVRWHACGAHVVGAIIAVDKNVSVVGDGNDGARAIALTDLAISRGLAAGRCARGCEIDAARTGSACARLAFRIHAHALGWDIAFDA